MTLTITHNFVSPVTDQHTAGEVGPDEWNAQHVVSGGLNANQITNIPFGIVTGTDVQAAINELEAAIPAPGPGTDPLFLTSGLNVTVTDPAIDTDINDRYALRLDMITDVANVNPAFANSQIAQFNLNVINGQNTYNALTQVKETFYGWSVVLEGTGSGQRFAYNNQVFGYGMGDVAIHGRDYVQFGGGATVGDEGQGWGLVSVLTQQNFLSQTTIVAVPTPSVVNTTTTQVITKSVNAQTVNVVSTAGAVNGDWVVVDQELPTDGTNMEAVQIISFTPTSITGIFRCNHNNGCTITPALLLTLGSTFTLGQDRVLVNWSQPSYSTGTVASIVGGQFNGSGTTWTTNMVGGWAKNIGAITLTVDNLPSTPFTALNPLKSVYQINSIVSGTALGILSADVAGNHAYRGKGPGPTGAGGSGAYTIVPCAKILRVVGSTVVCETSTSTWTIGDNVEQVICPYPDVTGFEYDMSVWTNGATCRSFLHVLNIGARKFNNFIELEGRSTVIETGADGVEWGSLIQASCRVNSIFDFNQIISTSFGIALPYAGAGLGATDAGGSIRWGVLGIQPNTTNLGMDWDTAQNGALLFSANNSARNADVLFAEMNWDGNIHLSNRSPGNTHCPVVQLDHEILSATNYIIAKIGYDALNPPAICINTLHGPDAIGSDIALITDGVEQLRCESGSTIKFSNPASFSANNNVATVLGSIGPTGSHTTVQKWLTVKDSGGVVLYIPCF